MKLRPIRTVAEKPSDLTAKWDRLYADAAALLEKRMAEYEVPTPERVQLQDMAVVYRLPYDYNEATGGVIHIPDTADEPEPPYSIGLLIYAGPEGRDILESHGAMLGDFVTFGRFAGEEETEARMRQAMKPRSAANPNGSTNELEAAGRARAIRDEALSKKKLLKLRVNQIQESVDLYDRLFGEKPTMEQVRHVNAKGEVLHLIQPL